ncbi:MAG: hypothetical protein IJ642_06275 [Oscillospiraceae bacterium]|nr:hypothetical protein [Oscillospiraceae bacterium]
MDYMDELFETWLPGSKDTPEAIALMRKMSLGKEEDYDELIACICAVSRQAFEGGFDCAVQLMKKGRFEKSCQII